MKTILSFFLFLISFLAIAQELTVDGGVCLGADYYHSYSYGLEILPNSHIVTSITVDQDNEAFTNYHGAGEHWVVIIDEFGNIVNERCFGGSQDDHFQEIEIYDEYIYFIGGTASYDGDVQSESPGGNYNIWVVKTDFDLNIIWEKQYGCLCTHDIETGRVTPNGGLILLADFFGTPSGDISNYYGNTDIWVCEIDANGELLWEKTLGNEYGNYAENVYLMEDGSCIILGETNGAGGMIDCNHHGMRDIWIVKLEGVNHEIEWQGCYGGSETEAVRNILPIGDKYIVTGASSSTDGDITYNHGGLYDAWLLEIDNNGQLIWEHCFGGSGEDVFKNIYLTETNTLIIIGGSDSEDGDVNQAHCPYSYCRGSAWVMELDSEKNILWNGTHGSFDHSFFMKNGIKRVGDRDFIIAGIVGEEGTHLGDVDCEPYPVLSGYSAWIYRLYDPNTFIKKVSNSSLKIYPNPAKNSITFELPLITQETNITLKDVFGKTIMDLPLYKGQTKLIWDCSMFPNGIYFYQTEIGHQQYNGKIIINN